MAQTIIYITAIVLLSAGVLLTLIPMFPALTYMFIIALAYGILDGFVALTGQNLLILFCLVVISFVIDHTAGALGAKYGGAHIKSMLWGILGAIVGTFVLPPLGTFIGLAFAVLAAELYYKKTTEQAVKAATGALLGSVVGVAVNLLLAIGFITAFIFFALR